MMNKGSKDLNRRKKWSKRKMMMMNSPLPSKRKSLPTRPKKRPNSDLLTGEVISHNAGSITPLHDGRRVSLHAC